MDFKEFKEKYFGKSVDEIKDGLRGEKNFWKNGLDTLELCISAGRCADTIMDMDKEFLPLYIFKKKYSIMFFILRGLTNIELIPEDESFDDYDSFVEEAILKSNSKAYFFKNMVEEIIKESQNAVINELYNTFNEGLPSTDDIQNMKEQLDNMFSNESEERLQTIESILSYNDPNIKRIKDFMFDPRLTMKDNVNEKNINNNNEKVTSEKEKEALVMLEKTREATEEMNDLINETPMVKEINDKIKEEQIKRVMGYNQQLEDSMNNSNNE